jgi:hypothetical protein
MRNSCGDNPTDGQRCGMPSCNLDTSVILLATPRCDRCIGSSCCDLINACYKERGCKLIVECVVTRCRAKLGEGLRGLGQQNVSDVERAICTGGRPLAGPGGGASIATTCIESCLDDFAPIDGGTSDDHAARCDSFKVYACGARSGCGDECIVDAGEADAGP